MSRSILVVDDHAPNREFIREALDNSAYEISEAQNASEALEYLRRQEINLVITDVRMPSISGVELLKRLQSQYPNIVVVLVSAFATVAGAVEAMKFGAHDYLIRPFEIDELRSVVQRAFDYHDSRIRQKQYIQASGKRPGFESILGHSKHCMGYWSRQPRPHEPIPRF